MKSELRFVSICGLNVASLNMKNAIQLIEEQTRSAEPSINIFSLNVDYLVETRKSCNFYSTLNSCSILLADGMPIVWLSKLLGTPLPERIAGSDLVFQMLPHSYERKLRYFLLGAAPGVAEIASKKLNEQYGSIVVGTYSPKREEILNDISSRSIVDLINESGANVLLVGFGMILQEEWIIKWSEYLNTNVNLGVGATIDFMAERIQRAPIYLRKLGMEWVFRLSREPKRLWKRYLIRDLAFIPIVIQEFVWLGIRFF